MAGSIAKKDSSAIFVLLSTPGHVWLQNGYLSVNMIMQTISRYKLPVHLTGWTIFFFAPLLFSPGPGFASYFSEPTMVLSMVARNLLLMVIFYLNLLYMTPVLLKNKGLGIFLVSIGITIIIVSLANSQIQDVVTRHFFHRLPQRFPNNFTVRTRPFFPLHFITNFLMAVMVASVSTTIVFWNDWMRTKSNEQERSLQKVASELAVLKLQISPHFLFNTLNNIRWLVRTKSDDAEVAVMKLSQLLRYILYKTNKDKVSLEKEVEHLKDYIDLQQMRLQNKDNIVFTYSGIMEEKLIVPLLLIPIVENFFKHADFTRKMTNSISLLVEGDFLKFKTENFILPVSEVREPDEWGIGLENVRKRLSLHYPGRHILKFAAEKNVFKLEMEVTLA
jgi:hypothetical protein